MITRAERNLKQITDSYNLVQIIEKSTRMTKTSQTRIDLVFTNIADRIVKTYNFLTGLSDHNFIFLVRKLTRNRFINQTNKPPSCTRYIPKKYAATAWECIKEYIMGRYSLSQQCGRNSITFVTKINKVISSFSRRGI